jgi:hypothetical protein
MFPSRNSRIRTLNQPQKGKIINTRKKSIPLFPVLRKRRKEVTLPKIPELIISGQEVE